MLESAYYPIQRRTILSGFVLLVLMLAGVACGGQAEPTVDAPPVELSTQTEDSAEIDEDGSSENDDSSDGGGMGRLLNPEIMEGPTLSPPPAAPEDLAAELVNGILILNWVDINDIEVGYLVFRTTPDADTLAPEIGRTEVNVSSYSDDTAQCGATYHYGVSGYNRSGFSFPSCIVVAIPDTCTDTSAELEFAECESMMPVERPAVLVPLDQ